jgi:hypothetical protein
MAKGKKKAKAKSGGPACHRKTSHVKQHVTYRCVHAESGSYVTRDHCGLPRTFMGRNGRPAKHIRSYGEELRSKKFLNAVTRAGRAVQAKAKKGYKLEWIRIPGETRTRCVCGEKKRFAKDARC